MRAAAKSATPTNSLTRCEAVDRLKSNLHDDGQHERPTAPPLPEEPPELDPQPFLDQPLVRALLEARVLHDVGQDPDSVGEQLLAVRHHETPGDDFRDAFESARLLVDRHHGDGETVL